MYKSFKEMPIWKLSMELAVEIFEITESFPKKEDYGVTSQIRRSALSISANIAEGFGRFHNNDKINFYYYARGSATETQSHLVYCKRVKYLNSDVVENLDKKLEDINKSLNKIIKTIRNS
mgnify:CR=1 FL=1|jgi:four helix bundle protein